MSQQSPRPNRLAGAWHQSPGLSDGSPVSPSAISSGIAVGAATDFEAIGIREIIIVDPSFDRYSDFVDAASRGSVGLHFCNDGLSALKLARRFRGDLWLVSTELPDMSGFDLLPILREHVHQGGVDPLIGGPRISLDTLGTGLHAGVFMVSDIYRLHEEQRALASGCAGYLVQPLTLDLVRALRAPCLTE